MMVSQDASAQEKGKQGLDNGCQKGREKKCLRWAASGDGGRMVGIRDGGLR